MSRVGSFLRDMMDFRRLLYQVYVVALARSGDTVVRTYIIGYIAIASTAWSVLGMLVADLIGMFVAWGICVILQAFGWSRVYRDMIDAREEIRQWEEEEQNGR